MKSSLILLVCGLALLPLLSCSHREFFADKPTREPVALSREQKQCQQKGIRWQWSAAGACVLRDFLGYCQMARPPRAIGQIITYLKNEVNLNDCQDVETALKKVNSLYLSRYQIEDIYPLISFPHLEILLLDHNLLSDLYPLAQMKQLRILHLQGNRIKDLSRLESLTNLVILRLDQNQITDLSPLSSMQNLLQLNLNDNRIKDLNPLGDLTSLKKLGLRRNAIVDVFPLTFLRQLDFLDLEENPISGPSFPRNETNCPHSWDTLEPIRAICRRPPEPAKKSRK